MRTLSKIIINVLFVALLCAHVSYAQLSSNDISHITRISEGVDAPLRIATDRQGTVYVTDAFKNSISKYDANGNFIGAINAVANPISLAVNPEGILFIGDGASGHIFRYDEATGATMFFDGTIYPNSMDFSPDNVLYVSDSKRQEVLAIDLSGNVIQTIGKGILDFPTGIAFDNSNKRIVVGEHGGKGTGFTPVVKVYMFNLLGTLLKSFGSYGNSNGKFYRVQGITIGKCGNIYVVDPYLGRISIFDENGIFKTNFGIWGDQPGELNIPMDIVFDSQERLVVTSMNNSALEIFNISDTLPCSNIRSGNAMICAGETADIEIGFTGTAPWTFTFSIDGVDAESITTSSNLYVLTVSEPGHYEMTALSDSGNTGTCFTGSADIIVTSEPPTAVMTGDASICEGETTEITVAFTGTAPWTFTYTRNGGNPVTITTVNNPHILQVTEAGLYEVISLEGGGCIGTQIIGSATINLNIRPDAIINYEHWRIEIEKGETADLIIDLTGTPPWSLTYTNNGLNPVTVNNINETPYILSVSEEGTYEIANVSDLYCSFTNSQEYWDIAFKSAGDLPSAEIIEGDYAICPGEFVPIPVNLTGNAPWTITYQVGTFNTTTVRNNFSNPFIINAYYVASYEVTALSDSSSNGVSFKGKAIVSANPVSIPDFDYSSNNLEVTLLNNSVDAESYFWDFGDGTTSEEISPVHTYETSGDYVVSLTAYNGVCSEQIMTKKIQLQTVSAEKIELDNILEIYPNPTSGMVTIEFSNPSLCEIRVEIISLNGSIVYTLKSREQHIRETTDLSRFPNGLYLVRVISADIVRIGKLIISD